MAKRMMDLNPNSFRKLVATFLEANGRVSFFFFYAGGSSARRKKIKRPSCRSPLSFSLPARQNHQTNKKPQGYWEADDEKIERLKQMYNEVEDKIEGVE